MVEQAKPPISQESQAKEAKPMKPIKPNEAQPNEAKQAKPQPFLGSKRPRKRWVWRHGSAERAPKGRRAARERRAPEIHEPLGIWNAS